MINTIKAAVEMHLKNNEVATLTELYIVSIKAMIPCLVAISMSDLPIFDKNFVKSTIIEDTIMSICIKKNGGLLGLKQ